MKKCISRTEVLVKLACSNSVLNAWIIKGTLHPLGWADGNYLYNSENELIFLEEDILGLQTIFPIEPIEITEVMDILGIARSTALGYARKCLITTVKRNNGINFRSKDGKLLIEKQSVFDYISQLKKEKNADFFIPSHSLETMGFLVEVEAKKLVGIKNTESFLRKMDLCGIRAGIAISNGTLCRIYEKNKLLSAANHPYI